MITIVSYIQNGTKAKTLHRCIARYIKEKSFTAQIITHSKYENFSQSIEDTYADIYILDFTDTKKGSKLAHLIRRKSIVPAIVMINVSGVDINKLLLVRPSAVLGDILETGMLFSALSDIISELSAMTIYFSFKTGRTIKRIPYSEIVCFESNAHKVKLWLKDSMASCCIMSKLDIIQRDVPQCFVRCHQSYIVNMNYIAALDADCKAFILLSKEKIYISRRMYADAVLRYEAFIQFKKDI